MLLQRLATGATGVKQARYRQGPTRGSEALVRACAVYTQPLRSLALAVQCETMHGVFEFRRGFCTLVLSLGTAVVGCIHYSGSVCMYGYLALGPASVSCCTSEYILS